MLPELILQVEPSGGSLAAAEIAQISVRFSPQEVVDCERTLQGTIANLAATAQQPRRSISGSVLRPWCHFDLPVSDYLTGGGPCCACCTPNTCKGSSCKSSAFQQYAAAVQRHPACRCAAGWQLSTTAL